MIKFRKRSRARQEPRKNETGALPTERLDVVAAVSTDAGCVREVNEDSCRYVHPEDEKLLLKKGVLLVVADGMGGHSAGEVASRLAVEEITRAYYDEDGDAKSALETAFGYANRAVHKASKSDDNLKGMGTTCTALVLTNGSAVCAHVGDSRAYLVREGCIYLMTEDHSAVMEMVKRGLISLEQARNHPDKNVILRALGSHPKVDVTTWGEPFPVRPGDRFLLCSDGLYDLVHDEEILQLTLAGDPQSACESLVALAKERGGHDNVTVAIAALRRPGERGGAPAPETREVEVAR